MQFHTLFFQSLKMILNRVETFEYDKLGLFEVLITDMMLICGANNIKINIIIWAYHKPNYCKVSYGKDCLKFR